MDILLVAVESVVVLLAIVAAHLAFRVSWPSTIAARSSVYELGYLAGGPRRAVAVVIVALHFRGAVRLARDENVDAGAGGDARCQGPGGRRSATVTSCPEIPIG